MKKTISINIAGILFHIEEDGFQKLKDYLESITKYFSTFEDSPEIIEDIESRIAELFMAKLSDFKQTLTIDDVSQLIATMGTTSDFEASMEADEPYTSSEQSHDEEATSGETQNATTGSKKLYRDSSRSIIGGVAAGLAHYMKVDPLWIRLAFLALLINVFKFQMSGVAFLAYIAMWIAIPANADLADNLKIKKLFRNGSSRVLGGVGSGIAAYFGVDVAIVRLLFVLSILLGGSGILIYIILWIITPEAKTMTEKMQMEGKPITLKNIENNVKSSLNVKDGEESPIIKILLFPFRLLSIIITGLGKGLGPILRFSVDAIRIAFGALLLFLSFTFIGGLLGFGFGTFNIVDGNSSFYLNGMNFPLELIKQTLDPWMMAGLFVILFIPALSLGLLGLSIIIKRSLTKPYVKWSLFAVWVLSFFLAASTIPKFIGGFSAEGLHTHKQSFRSTQGTPMLRLGESGSDPLESVEIRLKGHADSSFLAVVKTYSRGENSLEANENAQSTTYTLVKEGEDFVFDPKINLDKQTKYRFQNAEVTFYVPFHKVFRMDEAFALKIENMVDSHGKDIMNQDWFFTEKQGLQCSTCSLSHSDEDEEQDASSDNRKPSYSYSDELTYPFENFEELEISALMDVEVRKSQDESYSVLVRGGEDNLDDVYLNQVGTRLEVRFKDNDWTWWSEKNLDRVQVIITMPELKHLEISGASKGEVSGFDQDRMEIEVSGLSELYFNSKVKTVYMEIDGASKATMIGAGESLQAQVSGASKLKSVDFRVSHADIQVSGASSANVFAEERLNAAAAGVSTIKYRGTPKVIKEESGMSNVEKD